MKVAADEKNSGLRAQTTFSAGRPGVLKDPAPQGAVTVGYVAAPGLLLVVASLAGGDGVDATTVSYLLSVALAKKKEEEEKEKEEKERKLKEVLARAQERVRDGLPLSSAEDAAWRQWSGLPPRQEKKKRKKRKKRKLPRSPLPRCRRPCDLQRQVPAALRVLRVPRQNGGHSCSATETGTHSVLLGPGAILGQGRCAGVAQRQGYGQTVQNTVLVPQLQFIEGRQPPFVPQRQIPMVLPVQKVIETPQLQLVRWSVPLLCRSCHARCRSDRCSLFRHCRILWRCRRCSSFAVVDVPVLCCDKFPASPGGASELFIDKMFTF